MLTGVDVVSSTNITVDRVRKGEEDLIAKHNTQLLLALPKEERDFDMLIGERGLAFVSCSALLTNACQWPIQKKERWETRGTRSQAWMP